MQGIEDVYNDMLREKKEVVAYEDLEDLHGELPQRIFNWFPKERAHRDILIKTISRDVPFAREFAKRNRGLLREMNRAAARGKKLTPDVVREMADMVAGSPTATRSEWARGRRPAPGRSP